MLGVFRNKLTANDKYPAPDCVNFLSPIEMQLSLNPTICSDFFVPFPESSSNFKHFEKKMILIATLLGKLDTVKELVRPLSKKHLSRTPFESQHFKESQTLAKSA